MSPQFCIATYSPEKEKLSQLRAKTDSQVLDFIESKLETASRFVALAETEFSGANRAAAQESLGLADQAIGEAQTLLLIFDEHERRGLGRKLNQVTDALERVCRDRQLLRPLFLVARSTTH